jgi:hypothetical protein
MLHNGRPRRDYADYVLRAQEHLLELQHRLLGTAMQVDMSRRVIEESRKLIAGSDGTGGASDRTP